MLEFLIGRVEAMIATLDLSKGTKDPITTSVLSWIGRRMVGSSS